MADSKAPSKRNLAIGAAILALVILAVPTCAKSWVNPNVPDGATAWVSESTGGGHPGFAVTSDSAIGLSYYAPDGWERTDSDSGVTYYDGANRPSAISLVRSDLSSFMEPGVKSEDVMKMLAEEIGNYDYRNNRYVRKLGGNPTLSYTFAPDEYGKKGVTTFIDIGKGDVVGLVLVYDSDTSESREEELFTLLDKMGESVKASQSQQQ